MSKRMTDTFKWRDPWFRKLSPGAKLLWLYVTDVCDAIGVFDFDMEAATFHIGQDIGDKELNEISSRVQKIAESKYYILKFIEFQYGKLSQDCNAHKPVFKLVEKHKLAINSNGIGYAYPTDTLLGSLPDTLPEEVLSAPSVVPKVDKQEIVIPDNLNTPEFLVAWDKWVAFRKEIKKKMTHLTKEQQLKDLAKAGPAAACAAIEKSISNGWQGLFPEPTVEHYVQPSNQFIKPSNGHMLFNGKTIEQLSVNERMLLCPADYDHPLNPNNPSNGF